MIVMHMDSSNKWWVFNVRITKTQTETTTLPEKRLWDLETAWECDGTITLLSLTSSTVPCCF